MIVRSAKLTAEQEAKLDRLRLYGTRYEVALELASGPKVRLGYIVRNNPTGLRLFVSGKADAIKAYLNDNNAMASMPRGSAEISIFGWGKVCLTGRTQRQAIIEGELPAMVREPVEAAA